MPPIPEVIETPRLRLRPWGLGDVEDVLAYAQDPEWSRFLHLVPHPYSRGDAGQFIARQLLLDRAEHPSWAIELEGRAVGGLNLRFLFERRIGELGYSIARPHWGRGYVPEAAKAVIDTAFLAFPDLIRIRAFADDRNVASQRVMEKLGMTKEGVLRQNRIERDQAFDEAWWGLLRGEWRITSDGAAAS